MTRENGNKHKPCSSESSRTSSPAFDASEQDIIEFLEHADNCSFHESELKALDMQLSKAFRIAFDNAPMSSSSVCTSLGRPKRLSTLELLKLDASKWNKWRKETKQVRPRLVDSYLSGAQLADYDLSFTYLDRATLIGANLRNADLRGAVLLDANLEGANLSGADLRNADLRGINLSRAVLTNANLSGANLRNADLKLGTIIRAKLLKADLEKADLRKAILTGTDFSGAYLLGTQLAGTDLSKAIFDNAIWPK